MIASLHKQNIFTYWLQGYPSIEERRGRRKKGKEKEEKEEREREREKKLIATSTDHY